MLQLRAFVLFFSKKNFLPSFAQAHLSNKVIQHQAGPHTQWVILPSLRGSSYSIGHLTFLKRNLLPNIGSSYHLQRILEPNKLSWVNFVNNKMAIHIVHMHVKYVNLSILGGGGLISVDLMLTHYINVPIKMLSFWNIYPSPIL